MCGSKRRLKFRLRNTIVLFFIVLFGQNIFYFPKVLRTLSQCCQQSNHRNILKDLLVFFFSRIRNISHDSFLLKDGRGKCTYLLVRLMLVVIQIQLQVITQRALHQPQSQGLSSFGAARRETLGTRFALRCLSRMLTTQRIRIRSSPHRHFAFWTSKESKTVNLSRN